MPGGGRLRGNPLRDRHVRGWGRCVWEDRDPQDTRGSGDGPRSWGGGGRGASPYRLGSVRCPPARA